MIRRLFLAASLAFAVTASAQDVSYPPVTSVGVTSLPSLPAGNNNIGDVDVATLPSLPAGNNNIGDVDIASTVSVQGTTAHDSPISGNPLILGLSAVGSNTPVGVAAGDLVRGLGTLSGVQIFSECPPGLEISRSVVRTSTTSATELFTAGGASVRRYLRTLHIFNSSATTTRVIVRSGGSDKVYGAPAGQAITIPIVPAWPSLAGTNMTVETADSVASVYVTGHGCSWAE